MQIKDIQNRDDLQLVTNSQDVEFIKETLRYEFDEIDDFFIDSFFIKVENGDYSEAYGFSGCVPYLYKELYRLI